jgi:ubiquinone/menaquinone biosynthesis C-methylase UbiE
MALLILLLSALSLPAQVAHQHHPPRDAAEYLRVLNNPERDAWQKPHEVIQALALRSDEAIADIGAGGGYFSRRFARHAGRVLAVDVDEKLLAATRQDAPANLETVLAAHDDPKLSPASVDTIFFCNVLHHIDGRPAYYEKLARALRPGGRIVMMDFHKRELPVGPPVRMKLSREEVIAEMKAAGFALDKEHDFLPHQYFLEFRRAQ